MLAATCVAWHLRKLQVQITCMLHASSLGFTVQSEVPAGVHEPEGASRPQKSRGTFACRELQEGGQVCSQHMQ